MGRSWGCKLSLTSGGHQEAENANRLLTDLVSPHLTFLSLLLKGHTFSLHILRLCDPSVKSSDPNQMRRCSEVHSALVFGSSLLK